MKKLLIVLSVLLVASFAYADKASRANAHKDVSQAIAIGDVSSSELVEVDSDGNLQSGKIFHTGSTAVDSHVNTLDTACTVYGIYFMGETAGNYVKIYDGTSANLSNIFMFEVEVSAAHTPIYISFPGGINFTKECYVDMQTTTGGVYCTVFYNEND